MNTASVFVGAFATRTPGGQEMRRVFSSSHKGHRGVERFTIGDKKIYEIKRGFVHTEPTRAKKKKNDFIVTFCFSSER